MGYGDRSGDRSRGCTALCAGLGFAMACGDNQGGRGGGGTAEDGIPGIDVGGDQDASGSATEASQGTAAGSGGDGIDGTVDDSAEGAIPVFDVGAPGNNSCGAMGGNGGTEEFSYIWIANTGDAPPTVSKINTVTMIEEGRYATKADGAGNPSRTSVSLSGHAAVGNRAGGITKYYAYDCPPGPTSTGGPDSELPWGMDACVAWSADFTYLTQRPIAWTRGTFNDDTCEWEDEMIWSSGANGGNTVEVLRLDGDTGVLLDLVPIPELNAGTYGAYGGAVDGDNNFWISQLGGEGQYLVRIDAVTLEHTLYPHTVSGYGIQVDGSGRPWICGYDGQVGRFDPVTATWAYASTGGAMYGCMPDDNYLWVGGDAASVRGIDLETMVVVYNWPLTGIDSGNIHGTSIDFDGYVWGVSMGTMAARVHPTTGVVDLVGGLNSPYTYSDMTGYALKNVGTPKG